jgi:DNA-binding Xre family transcriptional regulator
MIRNDNEYQEAVNRIKEEKKRMAAEKERLAKEGLSAAEVKRALDPMRSFHMQLEEEVEGYEKLKRGEFEELLNFQGMGRMLIALRIHRGMSQRELAERLGVHESQVSRDERNEYNGITLERLGKVVEAFGVSLRTTVEFVRAGAA